MNDWDIYYIHGDINAFIAWMATYFPPTPGDESASDLPFSIPGGFAFLGNHLYPQEHVEDVVGDLGEVTPVYAPIAGREDVLALAAIRSDEGRQAMQALIADLPGIDVHHGVSPTQIAEMYPEHALGQVIPSVSEVR